MWLTLALALGASVVPCAERAHGPATAAEPSIAAAIPREPTGRRRAGGSRIAGSADRDTAPEGELATGAAIYAGTCAMCHQASGGGQPGLFPPLAGSDYLARDPARIVRIVLEGLAEPIVVNGEEYNGAMPPLDRLSDADVAAVATFVLNSWSNPGGRVTATEVAAQRSR